MEYSNTLKLHENEVVHCHTEKEAIEVLDIAHCFGCRWATGFSFLEMTSYKSYMEETCYDLLCGKYAPSTFYEENDKTIISAEEFLSRHGIKNHFMQNKVISIERLRSLHSSISYLNTTTPINSEVRFIGDSLKGIDRDKSKRFSELQLLNKRRIELIESILK